jgi:hypothetical protein
MKIIIEVDDLTNIGEWITNVLATTGQGRHRMYSRDAGGSAKSRVEIKSISVEASERESRSLGSAIDAIRRSAAFCTLTIRD